MPKTISKILHSKLLRSDDFKQILEDLYLISGMEALFLDEFGNECLRAPRKSGNKMRELRSHYPEIHSELDRNRQQQLAGAVPENPPYIEIAYPIRILNETVGFLVLSACRDPHESELNGMRLWTGFAKFGFSLSWSRWKEALDEFPLYRVEKREAWVRTLSLKAKEAVRLVEKLSGPISNTPTLPPRILKGCELIQSKYMEPLRMSEIARHSQVSAEHFSRIFHQHTGLRFSEYLAETRVRAACERLKETDELISKIAGDVGFSTLSRFNTAFKQYTGMTPRSYRKRNYPPLAKKLTI